MNRERQLRIFAVAVGVALVAVAVAVITSGSTREIAGGALVIASIAVFWAVFFSARLETHIEGIAHDVHRIAERVALIGDAVVPGERVVTPDSPSSPPHVAESDAELAGRSPGPEATPEQLDDTRVE